ncbi:MAG: TonB-dependent receptor [Acidobacteria bacterium]|nr:TonB-dependent receptor [Acidobacteriota bacterium]
MNRKTLLFTVLACLMAATTLSAQEVRASLSGIVSDPSGAPIPAAQVTVTNVAKNTKITTSTNESGLYSTPLLEPTAYTVTVEKDGFRRVVRENIVLQSLDKARLDIQLQIGAVADSITVNSAVSPLQTETANRDTAINNELIANLPTQGRNPFQIAWAAPGVFKTGGWRYLRSFDIGGTTGFSVNGGRSGENEVLMDGMSNVRSSRTVMNVPTMESVQEFKVLANTYDAQYGRTGGGVVTIVTKSGSNQFHGNLFEYFQNDKLNANQTELNAGGIRKSPNNINAYGFFLSGPVLVPRLFDGRNKLFWTLSYEAMRQRSADPGVVTVPANEWRGGDFSTLRNAQNQLVSIFDPLTTAADGTRTAFPGNVIPPSRVSPIATAVMKFVPGPTSAGSGPAQVNNYPYPSRWVADMFQWSGRLDYQVNAKNTTNFRYGQNPFSEYRGLVFVRNVSDSNPAEPTGNAPLLRNGRTIGFNWTSTLSPTLTFDLRLGLNRWEESSGNSYGTGYDPRSLGFETNLASQFTRLAFPRFDFTNNAYQSIGPGTLTSAGTNDTYTIQPNFNKVVGRHFLKFGVEARRYNDNSQSPGLASGQYSFNKNWTQRQSNTADATSGNEFATFLLGYPSSAIVDRNIDPAFVHFFYAGFIQDDFKVTSRLTLNLGLRWDYESPAYERYDRMVQSLDINAASPIAAQAAGLNLKGAVKFANVGGAPRGSFASDRNNWAPRAGFAYRIGTKWVVRGGYGLYYLGQSATGSNQGYSQRTTAAVTIDNLRPAVSLSNAFVNLPGGRLLAAVGNTEGAASFLGQGINVNFQNRPLPYSHQYSFDIQRELPGGILFEAAYVGNQTKKLPINVNANYVPASELGRRTATGAIDTAYYNTQVPNPMRGLIPNNAALNGATITRQALFNAFPQFSQVTIGNIPFGRQRYDAFQLKATKRFSAGMTFLASYTGAKTLEQVSLLNAQDLILADPINSPLVKQSADQIDIPRKFNLAAVWELPFGRGKKLVSNINKVADFFIGGWELNANITYMKGFNINYPNAAQVQPGSAALDNPTIERYFNTGLWNDANGRRVGAQEAFTLRTFPLRFSNVRLPGYQNWDASVSKFFPIHERLRAQFRFEGVNALNHPWYTGIASVDVTNAQFGRLNPTQGNLPRFLKLGLNLQF